jgi:hypothetical protein
VNKGGRGLRVTLTDADLYGMTCNCSRGRGASSGEEEGAVVR